MYGAPRCGFGLRRGAGVPDGLVPPYGGHLMRDSGCHGPLLQSSRVAPVDARYDGKVMAAASLATRLERVMNFHRKPD